MCLRCGCSTRSKDSKHLVELDGSELDTSDNAIDLNTQNANKGRAGRDQQLFGKVKDPVPKLVLYDWESKRSTKEGVEKALFLRISEAWASFGDTTGAHHGSVKVWGEFIKIWEQTNLIDKDDASDSRELERFAELFRPGKTEEEVRQAMRELCRLWKIPEPTDDELNNITLID